MALDSILILLVAVALGGLAGYALSEHRKALALRYCLLDDAALLFSDTSIAIAPDHFPILTGRLPDRRRVEIELVPDTLVFRRLPQLWLKLTLFEPGERRRPTIGALSRPTGAEFYSLVHGLPQWIAPPSGDASLLLRGDGCTGAERDRAAEAFQALFSDPTVKEAVITPRFVRLVSQAAQGDLGAHVLLRQTRFPIVRIPAELVRKALAEAEVLGDIFGPPNAPGLVPSAEILLQD